MLLPAVLLLAAGRVPEPAPPEARILHITSFGPAAGNGLRPRLAALDSRSRRLYVLNEVTRNISVVDLTRRHVAATIPLGDEVTIENRTRLLLDPASERLFITGPEIPGYRRSRILAISTRTLKVVAARAVEGTLLADAVLLPLRHELFTSAWRNGQGGSWGLDVFDTRTLEPLRRIPTTGEIVEIAADPKRNRLYTAEPDAEFNNGLGTLGKWGYGSVRVIARDPATGAPLHQSGKITWLMEIVVDFLRGRLIIPHGDGPATTGQGNVVTVLSGEDLSRRKSFAFRLPRRQEGRRLPFNSLAYDQHGGRLVANLAYGSGFAILDLRTGAVRAGPDIHTTLMDYPGPLDESAGELFGLVNNGITAISLKSLAPAWTIPLGAEVTRVFADPGRNRALVVTSQQESILAWASTSSGPQVRLSTRWNTGFDEIITVDFARRWIYYTLPTIHGGGGYLARMTYSGKTEQGFTESMPAHLYQLALAANGKKSWRGYIEFQSEMVAWVGVYDGPNLIRKVAVPSYPRRFAYAAAAGILYLVYPKELRTLDGRTVPLPRSAGPEERVFPVDVSSDGSRAYHADPKTRLLSVLRTSDGTVLAQRRLSFTPTDLAVDSAAGMAYLADGARGRVITAMLPKTPSNHPATTDLRLPPFSSPSP